ncbi:4-alpha-glucanotransferase [Volucribacter amazonae]|uniref:4-alpha-glucanotransferase n=1 Tax=Volucribacter amazonae TaxID=256731 RepID=A0A9X4P9I8_9PAST|nr:4-alpha-glucanotransferase [Volucribacter amazonae]MDG6895130.1 4-alpha-glucanotransferase [Volucribacter amazonae]
MKVRSIFNKKCIQAGILPYFQTETGVKQHIADQVKQKLFNALNGKHKTQSIPLPNVKVFSQHKQPYFVKLTGLNKHYQAKWQLVLENGKQITGKVKRNAIQLPNDLPLGYHQLTLNGQKKQYTCRIIISPHQCYQPQVIQQKQKLWGTFLQLYGLKSKQNWGIGDFADLKQFIQHFSHYQADFIGLNPIHSLFPANPDLISPYSPSSRRWLNIAYIHVNEVAEFQQSPQAQDWFNSETIQQQLAELRNLAWIDYPQVIKLKLTGLRLAFNQVKTTLQQNPLSDFAQFIQTNGEALQQQATFDALHHHLTQQSHLLGGWDSWAEAYQDYHSPAVQQFRQQYADEVLFYAWLQFLAEQQFAQCQQLCSQKGMSIGLYRDLAVGVANNGVETWQNQSLYSLNASIGAPPDILAPQGQNWGLAPMNPHSLIQQGYQPFIDLLRANMQHCGALRLDHIMALLRLWWIPKGDTAHNGAYIRYPVDDLIAILALESQRHQCLIIGEDLGTVPKEIIKKLADAGIFSYKIFYFEFDQQGQNRDLQDYPYQSMTTLSTHDLPTINGYWQGYDFTLGQQFGVYPDPKILKQLKQDRINAKKQILQRLRQHQIAIEQGIDESLESKVTKTFTHQLQSYVAKVNSALFGFQPEDWLNMREPVNIPGTSFQYANWQRKLTAEIDEIFNDPTIQQLLITVNQARKS